MCAHPSLADVDAALTLGESLRKIAERFSLKPTNLFRHSKHARAPAAPPPPTEGRVDILAELRGRLERADRLVGIAEGLVGRAAQREDWRTAVAGVSAATRALGESRACLELLARLLGEVPTDTTTVNVSLHAEWPALRYRIVQALDAHPDARASVLSALASVDGQHNGRAH